MFSNYKELITQPTTLALIFCFCEIPESAVILSFSASCHKMGKKQLYDADLSKKYIFAPNN